MNRFSQFALSAAVCLLLAFAALAGDDSKKSKSKSDQPSPASREASQEALAEFNSLVGGWRGVGQPQRNSNKGSWTESAEWVWEIKKEHVGIRYT